MSNFNDHDPRYHEMSSEALFDSLGLSLRPAVLSDSSSIKQLTQLAFKKYISKIGGTPRTMLRDYRQVIDQDQVWVVEGNRAIVAVLVLAPGDRHFHISNLAVHPTWQRQGLGKALLHHAEQQSQQAGYGEIWLHTNETMVGNIRLYASLGYEEMYRQTYHTTASVYMRKSLNPL